MFYFPGDLVGPDPSSAPLPSVLYFPGLMRARRLRLHRHHWSDWSCWSRWSSPLPLNYYFQAGGAPSRPWKLFNVVPRKDDGNDNRSKDNKRLYPVHGFMLPRAAAADVASRFVSSGLRGPSVFAAGVLTVSVIYLIRAYRVRIKSVHRSVISCGSIPEVTTSVPYCELSS